MYCIVSVFGLSIWIYLYSLHVIIQCWRITNKINQPLLFQRKKERDIKTKQIIFINTKNLYPSPTRIFTQHFYTKIYLIDENFALFVATYYTRSNKRKKLQKKNWRVYLKEKRGTAFCHHHQVRTFSRFFTYLSSMPKYFPI
jgi:hypothetical protein